MQEKYINRYNSFVSCLNDFILSKGKDYTDSFILSGIIQKFSLTFDLSWKVMKDVLIEHFGIVDFATGSPKDTLRTAYANKLITDDIWLSMLKVRNDLTHDYNYILANTHIDVIINKYIDVFVNFNNTIEIYFDDNK